jgi:ribosomal protein L7/L12
MYPVLIAVLGSSLIIVVITIMSRKHIPPVGNSSQRYTALIEAGASSRVAELLSYGKTIEAIRAYREENKVGLKEAKRAIDTFNA